MKKGLKTQKVHILSLFEHTSDNLTTIKVEPHYCSLHQICIQGPIPKVFTKTFWELAELKISVFLSQPFDCFFFCFKSIQINYSLWDTKDGKKCWWLLWFPEELGGGNEIMRQTILKNFSCFMVQTWTKFLPLWIRILTNTPVLKNKTRRVAVCSGRSWPGENMILIGPLQAQLTNKWPPHLCMYDITFEFLQQNSLNLCLPILFGLVVSQI